MNPSTDSGSRTAEAIEDVAAVWFWKKDSGNWTDQDQAEFEVWLNVTAHRVAYLRLKAGWKGAERLKALGAGTPRGEVPSPGQWGNDRFLGGKNAGKQEPAAVFLEQPETPDAGTVTPDAGTATPQSRSRFKRLRWALVASAILALGVTIYDQTVHMWWEGQYSTPIGGLDTISLADGSRVTLNTDTRISVDLGEKERRIELSKGEAFFVVAKDATRPFVVYAENKRVTAVGTEFSVRRDADDIKVVVTEGRVKLEHLSVVPQLENLIQAPPPPTLLSAGAVARTAKSDVLVEERSAPDAEQLLTWRTGYLRFEGTPLADAVAEFNRYNTRKIVIDDPSLAALRIGGNFRANNTDAFLWLLKSGFHVEIEEEGERVVLKAR